MTSVFKKLTKATKDLHYNSQKSKKKQLVKTAKQCTHSSPDDRFGQLNQ